MSSVKKNIIVLFRLTAFLAAFSALTSLIFEVYSFPAQMKYIYIARVSASLIAFVLSVISDFKLGRKYLPELVHVLILTQILSAGVISYFIPQTWLLNYSIAALITFLSAFLFSSILKNQIIIPVYYVVLFSASLLFNTELIYLNTLRIESASFIILLGAAVVIIAAINFKFSKKKKNGSDILLEDQELQKFKHFFENGVEGFFQVTLDGKFIFINNEFAKILGYEDSEELNNSNIFYDIFANPKDKELLDRLLEGHGKIKNYRIKAKQKSDEQIFLRLNLRLEMDDLDEPQYYEGSIQDITQQIKNEEDKKQIILKLKQRLKQLPSIPDTSGTDTSSIKTHFIANMSHDIKTPMNSIMGFLTLMENGLWESDEEIKEFAGNAKSSADSILEIINNILDIAKLEAGSIELEAEEFSIKDEVDKAVSIVNSGFKEKGLQVVIALDEKIPNTLIGDPTRYRQVMLYLLRNAIKYTDEGKVIIEASADKFEGEEFVYVATKIKDTGNGMEEGILANLFKPVERKKISKAKQGAGFGMVIAKELITMMGGKINVKSKVGEGTEVEFTAKLRVGNISVAPEEQPETEEAENIEEDIQINKLIPHQKNGKRLLLVEDNPISQKIELKILREIGYSVDAVSSGREAIEAVKTKSFNLVLMDIEMEDMDGMKATREIRTLEGDESRVPIIAVTAHSSMKDREMCLSAGMDDYIAKPINVNFLKMTIDQWLGRNH